MQTYNYQQKIKLKKYNSLHKIILNCKQKWQKQLINLKQARALDQQESFKQIKTLQMVTEMAFISSILNFKGLQTVKIATRRQKHCLCSYSLYIFMLLEFFFNFFPPTTKMQALNEVYSCGRSNAFDAILQ